MLFILSNMNNLIGVICAIALFAPEAKTYLDPGSGGMLLQILLGGIAGVFAVVKLYLAQIKAFFSKLLSRKER